MSGLRDDAFARSTLHWALALVSAASVTGMAIRAIVGEGLDAGSIVGLVVLSLCAGTFVASKRFLRASTHAFLSVC